MRRHPRFDRPLPKPFGIIDVTLVLAATVIACLALLFIFATFVSYAHARDLGQWHDDATKAWFESLMQPDNPTVSCCGNADAYWADAVESGPSGELVAVVTDERPDGPLRRHHVPVGTKIVVPPNKIKWDRGNPTGHIVIFLSVNNDVYCYVQNGGV